MKPRILISRRWPQIVEARLRERYDVTANAADTPLGVEQLRAAMGDYDALCPTVSDRLRWAGDLWRQADSARRILAAAT